MIIRNYPFQWLAIIFFLLIIFYLKSKLDTLQESNKVLQDEFTKWKNQMNNQIAEAKVDELQPSDDVVVIYNRVPKTGSTSFVGVAYDLCKKNKYHALHINITNNMHTLTLPNQMLFVNNITYWNDIKPAFYHGHMAFLNFEKLGAKQNPLYINLLRKPLDRFVSYYYFLRYGDNFRPHLIRKKHGDTKTFDECIRVKQSDCDPNNMWLQIPFLCGHDPSCWEVGNRWALEQAKRNLKKHYLLVGVTEELEDFIQTLEAVLPRLFKGAHDLFMHNNKSHLRQTTQKINPLAETVERIQKTDVWQMENELYNYALAHFHAIKKRIVNPNMQDANQHFMYEKIRPK